MAPGDETARQQSLSAGTARGAAIDEGADGRIASIDLRENLAAGRGEVRDLSPLRIEPLRSPSLLVGEVTPALMRSFFSQALVLGTSLYRIPDAEVAAEGIVLTEGRFNHCGQLNVDPDYAGRHHADLPARLRRARPRRIDDEIVLLAGDGYRMYGHWIVDYLPKLYLLHLGGYKLARLRYLLPADTPGFARQWLARLGIGEDRLAFYDPASELLACRSLLVPTSLRVLSRASPLLREARGFLLGRAFPSPRPLFRRRKSGRIFRRIFVKRSQNAATHNRRRLVERALFEEKAQKRGFEPVSPETLSLADQVTLFRSASTICGEYGSALHASLFAEPGLLVAAARHNGVGLGFVQSGIDQVLGHEDAYLLGGPPAADGGFSVRPEDMDLLFDWLDWRCYG